MVDECVSRTATETETLSRGVYATFHTRVVPASVPPTARKLPSSCLGTRARVAPNMTSYGQGKVPEGVLELRARAATRDVDLFFSRVTRTHAVSVVGILYIRVHRVPLTTSACSDQCGSRDTETEHDGKRCCGSFSSFPEGPNRTNTPAEVPVVGVQCCRRCRIGNAHQL